MIILDTSFLVAYYNQFDTFHKQSLLYSDLLDLASILYLDDVLKESVTVINARVSREASLNFLKSIYKGDKHGDAVYTLTAMEFFEILNEYEADSESRLSYIDSEIVFLAKKYNFKVISFDKGIIRKLPNDLVLRI